MADINSIYFQMDTNMVNAYVVGKQDYYDGKYRADNPYVDGSDEYRWWDCGYSEAMFEDLE